MRREGRDDWRPTMNKYGDSERSLIGGALRIAFAAVAAATTLAILQGTLLIAERRAQEPQAPLLAHTASGVQPSGQVVTHGNSRTDDSSEVRVR